MISPYWGGGGGWWERSPTKPPVVPTNIVSFVTASMTTEMETPDEFL